MGHIAEFRVKKPHQLHLKPASKARQVCCNFVNHKIRICNTNCDTVRNIAEPVLTFTHTLCF